MCNNTMCSLVLQGNALCGMLPVVHVYVKIVGTFQPIDTSMPLKTGKHWPWCSG